MSAEKKLTAMQELFLSLENTRPEQWIKILINDKEKLLQKEKQQIIEASNNSYINSDLIKRSVQNKKVNSVGEQYYNETFKK